MSLRAVTAAAASASRGGDHAGGDHGGVMTPTLYHQFEDVEQQNESYLVGMWTCLVQEIMFFGALFLAYTVYRAAYPATYLDAHKFLSITWGTVNTLLLLTSSFTMVMAVNANQHRKTMSVAAWLSVTILLSLGFLGVKTIEYSNKFHEGLWVGNFNYAQANTMYLQHHGGKAHHEAKDVYPYFPSVRELATGYSLNSVQPGATSTPGVEMTPAGPFTSYQGPPGDVEYWSKRAKLFFSLYFAMTGLHAVHIIIGILMMSVLIGLAVRKHPYVTQDYMPTEMVGLYWHFVDIVWIFLFPLMYLIS
jgi:Heme/copper-type cytochrome/quinol oxidase, subunit 3